MTDDTTRDEGLALKIREQHKTCANPKPGHRQAWTEYQVVCGRKVISRHDTRAQAERAIGAAQ